MARITGTDGSSMGTVVPLFPSTEIEGFADKQQIPRMGARNKLSDDLCASQRTLISLAALIHEGRNSPAVLAAIAIRLAQNADGLIGKAEKLERKLRKAKKKTKR